MDTLHICLVLALFGVASCSYGPTSGSESVVTVRPGDNVTLFCDCTTLPAGFIVWFRNCSHRDQPSLILKSNPFSAEATETVDLLKSLPPFTLVENSSSQSYDLQITNITESDGGLYFCGTEQKKVEDKQTITSRYVYKFGKRKTRIIFNYSQCPAPAAAPCWILLFTLCPACAVLSSLVSLLVYHLCQKKEREHEADQPRPPTSLDDVHATDEDVTYAALEMRQSKRSKKKQIQDSHFSTYSAINTTM